MKNLQQQFKLGTVLIWLGVFVWAPYFVLRLSGESPNLIAYLPFHLLGVLGGARLRTSARKQLGLPKPAKKGYRRVAHWLVLFSIFVWALYYGLKLSGQDVEITPFLNMHLVTIFSGTGLLAVGGIVEQMQKKAGNKQDHKSQIEPITGVVHGTGYTKEDSR